MYRSRGVVFGIALLLALITISAASNQLQQIAPKRVSVNDLKVEITTTKSVYNVGEVINGTIWLVNETPQPVHLDPIYTAYLTAGYTSNLYSATRARYLYHGDVNLRNLATRWRALRR
jgi:hypothetical protein